METVDLLSCMYSEGSYYWGLVWVELPIDWIFEGMVMEVVDFDVVGSDGVVEDFVENFVEDFEENFVEDFEDKNVGMVDRMVDIDSMESIFHRDFVFLVPRTEIDFEIGAKAAAKDSKVEVDYTFDHGILVFEVPAKAF